MNQTFFDKLWNRVLLPVADFFYPTNDCAVCYFWRAFVAGVWAQCVLGAVLAASWKTLFLLAVIGAAFCLWMRNVDSRDN
jgi:hypothetical protein